ncbi:MAG: NADH-quinone oxidoreductase subunit N [Actinomycetota bacterium]|nr:NADH-quinone oxidoreductase subunit N [Actinomycetota bacterium]
MIGLLATVVAQATPGGPGVGGAGGLGGATTPTTQPGCVVSGTGAVQGLCTSARSLHIPFQYRYVAPELILIGGALLILTVSALLPKRSRRGFWMLLTVIVGLASLASAAWTWHATQTGKAGLVVGNALVFDGYTVFFAVLVSSAVVLSALIADSYLRREGLDGPEFYVLALLSGSGAMIMAAANDLIVVFLGLEILSIALYIMAAYHRRRSESGEASMKYFILGAFSSAIFLYGAALCYGATGTTRLSEIAVFIARTHVPKSILLAGVVLVIVGLGFKVAAVPFHTWTPDVYQGSPTPATGFMGAVAKAGGFAALIRVLVGAFGLLNVDWRPVIWVLAALTLIVGSVLAIVQTDVKRMLAYSSISHAGYVLVGLQAATGAGTAGALFYLMSYMFLVLGSFAIVSVVSGKGEARNDLGGFRGLALRRPGLALSFTVLLLAQAGVPFTAGFFAKFYVVAAAVGQHQYVLAVLAMLAAAVAAFFYLRVAIFMYSPLPSEAESEVAGGAGVGAGAGRGGLAVLGGLALAAPPETGRIEIPAGITIALAICVAFTIVFGVAPTPLIHFARHASLLF